MHKVIFTQSVGEHSAHGPSPKAPKKSERAQVPHARLPRWMKVKSRFGENFTRVKKTLRQNGLHSVCEEAACPNIRECFDEGTATFMILGDRCTRNCRFCDVIKAQPLGLDEDEPERMARGVAELKLKQVVITSVTRDDLPDGGAAIFARTVRCLREQDPHVKIELLTPDFRGDEAALRTVLDSGMEVFAHNIETVPRLHKRVRGAAKLDRSLWVLNYAHNYRPRPVIKTGLMIGLGERIDEIVETMNQVYAAGVDILTIGQYLRPSPEHLPIERFYHPDEFAQLAQIGREIGFAHVESGPLVRSSYKAFNQSKRILEHAC